MVSKVVVPFVCFLLNCGVLMLETHDPRSGIGWRKRYGGRDMEEEEEEGDGGISHHPASSQIPGLNTHQITSIQAGNSRFMVKCGSATFHFI